MKEICIPGNTYIYLYIRIRSQLNPLGEKGAMALKSILSKMPNLLELRYMTSGILSYIFHLYVFFVLITY